MAFFDGGTNTDAQQRRQPSFARANGRQAVADAIQNHMDKLEPNKTKAAYTNIESVRPQSAYGNARAHAINANNIQQNGMPAYFTPKAQNMANVIYRKNSTPLQRLLNRSADATQSNLGLRSLGKQVTDMFNPTTKAGLVNIASMFAGGAKDGDASPAMESLGMPGQFTRYDSAQFKTGGPLDRGVVREGPISPTGSGQGAGIRGLVRRSQGVGGYKRLNPGQTEMTRLEAELHQRQMLGKTQDAIKEYSNRQGFANRNQGGFNAANQRTDMLQSLDNKMGMRSIPYVPREALREENRNEEDISGPRNLDTLMQYLSHYMNRGHDFNIGSQKAAWDQLFGGEFHFGRGFNRLPRKP